jgi:hypothetical protein
LARRIPQWVKDIVWARDGGSCSYPRAGGGRCGARGGLEAAAVYWHTTDVIWLVLFGFFYVWR